MLAKAIDWFVMGICFGGGFLIAQAVMHFVGGFLVKA
jgi:hypothetical protein